MFIDNTELSLSPFEIWKKLFFFIFNIIPHYCTFFNAFFTSLQIFDNKTLCIFYQALNAASMQKHR